MALSTSEAAHTPIYLHTLDGIIDIVDETIERIRKYEPKEGYCFSDSFGKDSGAVKHLLDLAGVKYDAHHNKTTVDPPQLMRHGLKNHPDTIIERPKITMWDLIVKKGFPPTRRIRYCCDHLKERTWPGRLIVTGKRRLESHARSGITLIEKSRRSKRTTFFNPIFDWSDSMVWEFTIHEKIPYCELYDQGFSRLGCVMCPLAGSKQMEFEAGFFPKHYTTYLRTFDRMIKNRPDIAEHFGFKSPLDVMHWWMYASHLPDDKTTQMLLDIPAGTDDLGEFGISTTLAGGAE